MAQLKDRRRGFSFVEMMVATTAAVIVLAATIAMLRQSLQVNSMLGQRVEMQQNARVAVNFMAGDLTLAGTGLPLGGIQLPSGTSSVDARFGCSDQGCYVSNNTYPDDRLYSITPSSASGPVLEGTQTDMVTLAYRDGDSNLDDETLVSVATNGTSIQLPSSVAADAARLRQGDVLALCNINGCALGTITGVSGTSVQMASGDPLRYNQPAAEFGNITALADSTPEGRVYPPTRAFLIKVVTFYVDAQNHRLMRQVNAHDASPVAEDIEDLQFDYDIVDAETGTATNGVEDAGGKPNQIRKINIDLRARATRSNVFSDKRQRIALSTSVSARNLTFRDRYQ